MTVPVRAWLSRQRATARAIWTGHAGPCERRLASRKSATQAGRNSTAQTTTAAVSRRPDRRANGAGPAAVCPGPARPGWEAGPGRGGAGEVAGHDHDDADEQEQGNGLVATALGQRAGRQQRTDPPQPDRDYETDGGEHGRGDSEGADALVAGYQPGGDDGAGDDGPEGDSGGGTVRHQPVHRPHAAEGRKPGPLRVVLPDAVEGGRGEGLSSRRQTGDALVDEANHEPGGGGVLSERAQDQGAHRDQGDEQGYEGF